MAEWCLSADSKVPPLTITDTGAWLSRWLAIANGLRLPPPPHTRDLDAVLLKLRETGDICLFGYVNGAAQLLKVLSATPGHESSPPNIILWTDKTLRPLRFLPNEHCTDPQLLQRTTLLGIIQALPGPKTGDASPDPGVT